MMPPLAGFYLHPVAMRAVVKGDTMTGVQSLFKAILPRTWADDMEAESKKWIATCECGNARSIWELGGIRWRAKGNPKTMVYCPNCRKYMWHRFEYQAK